MIQFKPGIFRTRRPARSMGFVKTPKLQRSQPTSGFFHAWMAWMAVSS